MSPPPDNSSSPETVGIRKPDDSLQTLMLYRMGRSIGWIAFFAFVIALGAAAGGYALWSQLNLMQEQADQLQDMADKTQKSFEASRVQSDALIKAMQTLSQEGGPNGEAASRAARSGADGLSNADRPWVGIDFVTITPLTPNTKPTVTATVRNSARTPALNVKVALKASVSSPQPDDGGSLEECATCPQSVLLPNMGLSADVGFDGGILSFARVSRVKAGEETIWLTGRIHYKDLLARPHTTRVCMNYVPKTATFSACPEGNRFD
jgi:hypothetical protein